MTTTQNALDWNAVYNFLASLDGLSYQEARANLELDKRSHGWSHETSAAIAVALCGRYFPAAGAVAS